ncbi:MAG: carboxymuconolactone decarboxylase family protein [Mycobacterium sp.]
MARIEPLPADEWPNEMQAALAAIKPPNPRYRLTQKGRPSGANMMGTMAHHPALARAYNTLNGHLLLATTLTERQRELIIMRAAAVSRSSYEWAQHVFLARDAGLTELEIGWIAFGPDAQFWGEDEAALLRAVDELLADGAIGDHTWTVLSGHMSTQQLLDVIFTAGSYTVLAWMVHSLGVELDGDLRDALGGAGAWSNHDQ